MRQSRDWHTKPTEKLSRTGRNIRSESSQPASRHSVRCVLAKTFIYSLQWIASSMGLFCKETPSPTLSLSGCLLPPLLPPKTSLSGRNLDAGTTDTCDRSWGRRPTRLPPGAASTYKTLPRCRRRETSDGKTSGLSALSVSSSLPLLCRRCSQTAEMGAPFHWSRPPLWRMCGPRRRLLEVR